METRNCKSCGKLFNYIRSPICPSCEKELDKKFEEVKAYIYDHPGAGMKEVCDENEVSQNTIKRWIKEERLSFSEDSQVTFACEKCGATIRTGRFCKQCKGKMQNELGGLYHQEPVKKEKKHDSNAKMRFLG
jgi:flagellar operon protein (TIGR03826 family)